MFNAKEMTQEFKTKTHKSAHIQYMCLVTISRRGINRETLVTSTYFHLKDDYLRRKFCTLRVYNLLLYGHVELNLSYFEQSTIHITQKNSTPIGAVFGEI